MTKCPRPLPKTRLRPGTHVTLDLMLPRVTLTLILTLGVAGPLWSQASQAARIQILHTVIAERAAARIGMPFGGAGINLSETGVLDRPKLEKEIKNNGESVQAGRVVGITAISFSDREIEVELDGGGKAKTSVLKRVDGVLGGPSTTNGKKVNGSKVTLQFEKKVPTDITPERLKELLAPVLDFSSQGLVKSDLDSLPAEFREAVLAKKARIGMDSNTVLLALGRPNTRIRDKSPDGVDQVTWRYNGAGLHATLVVFEDDVVVGVKEF
jgi:hypothetical protein